MEWSLAIPQCTIYRHLYDRKQKQRVSLHKVPAWVRARHIAMLRKRNQRRQIYVYVLCMHIIYKPHKTTPTKCSCLRMDCKYVSSKYGNV